jgi:hypothetical protein
VVRGVVPLNELPEASGVAASRRTRGVFWAHNDSAEPLIFALNDEGGLIGRIRVSGAEVQDWEDIAVGPCQGGSCVYIGDIGDNANRRNHITVYRAVEPAPKDAATQPAEVFEAMYPDGAHDAEALFVTSSADVYVITKGDGGSIALYRFPQPLTAGKMMRLDRIGQPALDEKHVHPRDRVTGADVSFDGHWAAVRTARSIAFYRAAELIAGRWRLARQADLSSLGEPRGEGIAFGADGTIALVGEGGGHSNPGTFAQLACALHQ